MHRYARRFVFLLFALAGCASSGSIEMRHDRFDAFAHTDAEHEKADFATRLAGRFQRSFGPALIPSRLAAASDRDLELLFRAARLVTFYVGDKTMPAMEGVLSEMTARQLAKSAHYTDMYEVYVRERFFARASGLFATHPAEAMQPLPTLVNDGSGWSEGHPSHLVVGLDDNTLTRSQVNLRGKTGVLVVFHPLCHFSVDAFRAIEQDPALGRVFQAHAMWLAPARDVLHSATLQDWNRQHPASPVSIAYRPEEWSMIDSWATPTFYFFKQGAVVAKVVGWPKEGSRSGLLQAAQVAGLQPQVDD